MSGRVHQLGASGHPIQQALAVLALGVLLVGAVALGAVIFVAVLAVAAVAFAIFAVRIWWLRRKLGAAAPNAGEPADGDSRGGGRLIEGEYTVVEAPSDERERQRRVER
jgi:hypothetical protein